ncbi:hypothetical protein CEB3_c31670 [Peptococcaceae bacterium CEB3]|nr:hypothetical protein CEB3_c31670 [Peptococcaceae bacterium CEB3]
MDDPTFVSSLSANIKEEVKRRARGSRLTVADTGGLTNMGRLTVEEAGRLIVADPGRPTVTDRSRCSGAGADPHRKMLSLIVPGPKWFGLP